MAISHDAIGSGSNSGTSCTANITIGAGSNRVLYFSALALSASSGFFSAETVGGSGSGVTLVLSESYTDGATQVLNNLYYLLAPGTGSQTISVTFSTSASIFIDASSYAGVKQSAPNATHSDSTPITSSASFTIGVTPSVATCWAIGSVENHTVVQTATSGCIYRAGIGGGAGLFDSDGTIAPSTLHNFVVTANSGTPKWSGVIVAIEAAASAATTGAFYYGYAGYLFIAASIASGNLLLLETGDKLLLENGDFLELE